MDTPSKPDPVEKDPNEGFGPPDEDDSTDIEPVAPAKPKAKPTPEKPVVSPSLRRTAKMFGISDDDIDNTSPDQLQDAIAYIAEERERSRAAQPAKPVTLGNDEEDDDSILESLDKELQLDPRLKKLLKKQTGSAKEIKELKSALVEQGKREQARLTRAGNDAADDAFDSLGDDFKEIFGDGDIRQLKKDGDEFAARLAVYQSAGIDLASDSPSSIKRKIMGAAKKLYGKFAKKAAAKDPEDEEDEDEEETEDTYTAPVKPKAKPKAKSNKGPDLGLDGNTEINWEEAGTARPTNRKTPEKKGVKAAANAVRQFYQEKGFPGSADEDVFNGVPE